MSVKKRIYINLITTAGTIGKAAKGDKAFKGGKGRGKGAPKGNGKGRPIIAPPKAPAKPPKKP